MTFSILPTKSGASGREDSSCRPAPRAEIVMVDYRVNGEVIECLYLIVPVRMMSCSNNNHSWSAAKIRVMY